MALELGWALDFIDKPADNLDFNFWSGSGDLTLSVDGSDITYKGANGVISITPPREEASTAAKMTAVVDASDPNIRKQLRRDVGPLRVRMIWMYRTAVPATFVGDYMAISGPGSTSFGILFFDPTTRFALLPVAETIAVEFTDTGGVPNLNTSSTFYVKKFGGNVVVFPTETDANNAGVTFSEFVDNIFDGVVNVVDVSGGTDYSTIRATFDTSLLPSANPQGWALTSKRFIGRLSSPNITGGIYSVDIESMISDIDRARTEYWSNDTQLAKHPGDKCFEYMREYSLNGIDTKWPP